MEAEYIQSCNCEWWWPCNFDALPTHGHCEALVAYRVKKRTFGGTKRPARRDQLEKGDGDEHQEMVDRRQRDSCQTRQPGGFRHYPQDNRQRLHRISTNCLLLAFRSPI